MLHNLKVRKICFIFIAAVIFVICVGFGSYKYNKAQTYSNLISAGNKDMDNGEYDQAIALFKQALNYKSDPMIQKNIKLAASLKEAKNIYDDGVKLMNDKKYSDAIEKFNKITKEDDKLYDNAQKNIDKCKSELSKKEKSDSANNINTTNANINNLQQQMAYKPFKNGRYEYSIEYPSFLQIQYPLPTNGDGVNLVTPNGDTKLTISGRNNGLGETPVTVYNDLLQDHPNASYKKQSGNQVIFSWIEGDSIVYKKQIVGSGSINSFVIKYPISQKSYYNSIIDHLSSSFNTPGINDTH